jgi:hypothetical protein
MKTQFKFFLKSFASFQADLDDYYTMKRLFFYFLFVFLGVVFETEKINASLIRAPSVFGHHEADLHKYSAVLAATEPFRLQCQSQLKQSLNPIKYWSRKLFGEL